MTKVNVEQLKQEVEQELKVTAEADKENVKAEDDKKVDEIFNARQEIFINGVGEVIFEYPKVGLSLEADMIAARFKSYHLKLGDLLTEQQLKFIYKKPTTITIDGNPVIVGDGSWTDQQEKQLEDLPNEIKTYRLTFSDFRESYQEALMELTSIPEGEGNEDKIKELNNKATYYKNMAVEAYGKFTEKQLELLELQALRMSLFSISLEEMANLEKIKLYIPHCIKKKDENGNEVPLWNNQEEALGAGLEFIKIISIFNLFLRGGSVDFFDERPEGQIIS